MSGVRLFTALNDSSSVPDDEFIAAEVQEDGDRFWHIAACILAALLFALLLYIWSKQLPKKKKKKPASTSSQEPASRQLSSNNGSNDMALLSARQREPVSPTIIEPVSPAQSAKPEPTSPTHSVRVNMDPFLRVDSPSTRSMGNLCEADDTFLELTQTKSSRLVHIYKVMDRSLVERQDSTSSLLFATNSRLDAVHARSGSPKASSPRSLDNDEGEEFRRGYSVAGFSQLRPINSFSQQSPTVSQTSSFKEVPRPRLSRRHSRTHSPLQPPASPLEGMPPLPDSRKSNRPRLPYTPGGFYRKNSTESLRLSPEPSTPGSPTIKVDLPT
ncbi:hypothetical protein DIPPA_59540 [Diplonema papillatum]|nr:hypothetical protein DIPPA_59540 [Diplonema papillatum]